MSSSEQDPEKSGGLSENTSRVIEAILTALVILSGVLTVYISPYFTITAVIMLVLILVGFLTAKDKHATERYKARLNQQL
jgi:Flp pilus assembly protein TadB